MALASTAQEAVCLRLLFKDFGEDMTLPTIIYEDNQSTIAMSKNPQFHGRAKHVDIKFHFIREQICSKTLELEYCPSSQNVADIFTKSLPSEKFTKFRTDLGVLPFVY